MKAYQVLHWFPFCPTEWISRCSNAGLSVPAQGVLIRLLCVQWLERDIPSDLTQITKILGGYTGPDVHDVLKLFVSRQTTVGRLYFPPMEAAYQEALITHRKRSTAGRKGGQSRIIQLTPTPLQNLS